MEGSGRAAAAARQTCQCENSPLVIGNAPVALKSAANLQNARTHAVTAPGVSSEASAKATCWFFRFFDWIRGPWLSRILTRIPVESQFTNSFTLSIDTKDNTPYEETDDRPSHHPIHGHIPP